MKIEKVVYICHEYGGNQANADAVSKLIHGYAKIYPEICFMSPIHAFGHTYDEVEYDTGMEYCLVLLDMCDEMWIFGNHSVSRGCLIEREYCKRYKIPIIEKW